MRVAFTMRLKAGALAEYQRQHDQLWPELAEEINRSGITQFSTYVDDPVLFLYSEVTDDQAWDRLWRSDVHLRWSEVMRPLMDVDADGIVESATLSEVFHFTAQESPAVP